MRKQKPSHGRSGTRFKEGTTREYACVADSRNKGAVCGLSGVLPKRLEAKLESRVLVVVRQKLEAENVLKCQRHNERKKYQTQT